MSQNDWQLISVHNGVRKYVRWNNDGTVDYKAAADIGQIIDQNRSLQADGFKGFTESKDMQHVAHIPDWIQILWRNMYGIDFMNDDHWPKIMELLDDPEWSALRTSTGYLQKKIKRTKKPDDWKYSTSPGGVITKKD